MNLSTLGKNFNNKRFFINIILIQIIVLVLVELSLFNIKIPILRQLIYFIYLSFLPGILILKILGIYRNNLETFFYSIGLSLAFLMFLGLFANSILPILGIKNPISPLIIYIIILSVIFLTILCYFKVKRSPETPKEIKLPKLKLYWLLFFIGFPFLSVFATYLINYYNNSTLQMILIILIAVMPITLLKWVPKKYYPLAIFSISLSLLYHTSLISPYLWGSDSWGEYYFSNLVLTNFSWDITNPNNYNGMLSVSILFPIYSIFTGLNVDTVLKLIIPSLFSVVPVGLFEIYKKQTNEQIALMASLFFMFVYTFYNIMPTLGRQSVSEIFLMLMLLAIFSKISPVKKSILFIIFGISLTVSHYGVSVIFMIIMIIALLLMFLNTKINVIKGEKAYQLLNKTFPLLFIIFSITWFIYLSSSSVFIDVVKLGNNMLSSLTELFNPTTTQGLSIIQSKYAFLQNIEKYLYLLSQALIGIGLLSLWRNLDKMSLEFKIFSISSFLVAFAGILLPYFASALNSDRLFHITLFFLAPFFVIGILECFKILRTVFKKNISEKNKKAYYVTALFLMILFIFSSSLIYQITDDTKIGRFALDNHVDFLRLNNQEMASIQWLNESRSSNIKVYADTNKAVILNNKIGGTAEFSKFNLDYHTFERNSILFFGTNNLNTDEFLLRLPQGSQYINGFVFNTTNSMNKIYDNHGSVILISRGE